MNERISHKLTQLLIPCLAGFVPALFVALWCVANTQWPISDGSDYTRTAGKIYELYQDGGVLALLKGMYMERGWRPIIFPLFMLPFMLISKGSILFSYAAVSTLSIFIGSIYIYKILNLILNRLSAFIAAGMAGSLPVVLFLGLDIFFSEVALYPVLLMFIYHYALSNHLANRKQTILMALAISMAIMIRPIEAVAHLALPITLIMAILYRKKRVDIKELKWAGMIFLSCMIILLTKNIKITMDMRHINARDLYLEQLYVKAYIILIAMFILYVITTNINHIKSGIAHYIANFRNNPTRNFILAALIIVVPPIVWFYPFSHRLIEWTYQCTIGGLAQGSSVMSVKPSEVFLNFIIAGGVINIILVTAGVIISLAVNKISSLKIIMESPVFYMAAAIVPVPLLLSMYTVQTTIRKTALLLPLIIVCMTIVCLQKGRFFFLRASIIMLGTIVQWAALIYLLQGYYIGKPNRESKLLAYTGATLIAKPVLYHPNPHDVTLKFLVDNAFKYKLKNIGAQLFAEHYGLVDPFLLLSMAEYNKSKFTMGYPYYDKYSENNLKLINKQYDALLLINPFGKMQPSKQLAKMVSQEENKQGVSPWEKTTFHTLYLFAAGKMNNIGWKKGPCYTFIADKEYEGCLFLKS